MWVGLIQSAEDLNLIKNKNHKKAPSKNHNKNLTVLEEEGILPADGLQTLTETLLSTSNLLAYPTELGIASLYNYVSQLL